jgi:thioredoxin-related protein
MKKFLILAILLANLTNVFGQDRKVAPYNVTIDGMKQLDEAIKAAGESKKFVLVQVGGNWCPWCIKFNNFCHDVPKVDSILTSSFVFIHLNYSKENRNYPSLERLGYPQRFGFPVMVVLDGKGNRLHIQDSGFLEKDKSYDTLKVVTFLKCWSPEALDPKNYEPKN